MDEEKVEVANIDIQDELKAEEKPTPTKRKKSVNEKECEVLVYNSLKKTMIISFDGYGYELSNIEKDPGKKVVVKYSNDIHSPKFKLWV